MIKRITLVSLGYGRSALFVMLAMALLLAGASLAWKEPRFLIYLLLGMVLYRALEYLFPILRTGTRNPHVR